MLVSFLTIILSSLVSALPSPSGNVKTICKDFPETFEVDLAGWRTCSPSSAIATSGTIKIRGTWGFTDEGGVVQVCGRSHLNIVNGKGVDAQGNEYVIIGVDNTSSMSEFDGSGYSGSFRITAKFKFVGKGPANNYETSFSAKCEYSGDYATNQYTRVCKRETSECKYAYSNFKGN